MINTRTDDERLDNYKCVLQSVMLVEYCRNAKIQELIAQAC